MTQVLDYSAGLPGALAIARDGYAGAVRYIGYPGRAKCTNANEFQDFSRNGVGMALVFENSATWWRRGFAGGQADAATARAHADAIGFPHGRPIYYAIDQQVSNGDLGLATDYIRGVASIEGVARVGVYGQYSVVKAVAAAGVAKYFWQCRAWSGTPIQYFSGRHLFQMVGTVYVGGVGCDVNDVLADDWGQHKLEDTMSAADAYNGFAQALKDMAAGQAPDLRQALQGVVWTTDLAVPANPDNINAEARVALLGQQVKDLTADVAQVKQALTLVQPGGAVDLDALADKIVAKIANRLES